VAELTARTLRGETPTGSLDIGFDPDRRQSVGWLDIPADAAESFRWWAVSSSSTFTPPRIDPAFNDHGPPCGPSHLPILVWGRSAAGAFIPQNSDAACRHYLQGGSVVFGPLQCDGNRALVWLDNLPLSSRSSARWRVCSPPGPENWVGRISRSRLTGLAPVRDYFLSTLVISPLLSLVLSAGPRAPPRRRE